MKQLLVILFVFMASIAMSQETVTIAVKDLTSAQLTQIKNKKSGTTTQTIQEETKSWVGIGKEVGEAMNSGLMAVVDASEKFADTKVGKYTILFIGWKIVGKDIAQIVVGFIFFLCGLVLIYYSLRRLYPRRVIMKKTGFFSKEGVKEYKIIEPREFEAMEFVKIIHLLALVGLFALSFAIMF